MQAIRFVECEEIVTGDGGEEDVCGNIAEVFQRYYHEDGQGRLYFFRTRCLQGHILDVTVTRDVWVATG